MGPVTLTKQNRLFWLGRYAERVYMTVQLLMKTYDTLLDGADSAVDYADICRRLGVQNVYQSAEDFCRRYLFDAAVPGSVRGCMDNLLGNGMVLRETISTPHPGLSGNGRKRHEHGGPQRSTRRGVAVGAGRHHGFPGQL